MLKKDKINIKGIGRYFAWMFIVLLLTVDVFYTISSAVSGAEISNLENKEVLLKDQNRVYKEEMVVKSSLTSIEKKAMELGFVKPQEVVYIAEKETVAKLP